MEQQSPFLPRADYLSVREAALRLGVSTRSVYSYVGAGKLQSVRIGTSIAIPAEILADYKRSRRVRPRARTPVWRLPGDQNQRYLTMITIRLRQERQEQLEQKLAEMRAEHKHLLPETVARYITQSPDCPQTVRITLLWREAVIPPAQKRKAALAALQADLAHLLDWDTASTVEGLVLLNT